MNNTAKIQASFSLPEVLLEDKIERMGNNQTKMMMPKMRRAVKSSIPGVYAYQRLVYGACIAIADGSLGLCYSLMPFGLPLR